jgi:rSAM/selenodomain-associated transferase 1
MSAVLGVFAKWPAPGLVKTRLGFSAERAATVARAFLLDTLGRLSKRADHRRVVFAPALARAEFAQLVPSSYDLEPQGDGDLGARMERFITAQFAASAHKVVVVGADSPTLPIDYVDHAFSLLDDNDLVLGPATDGGYYLVGCRRPLPIFAGISWSAPTVLAETIARLHEGKLALLPPWYDVDTPESWAMLRGHVAAQRRAGIDPGIVWTEPFLDKP